MPQLDHQLRREKMVQNQLVARGIYDPSVLGAMRRVPRHRFVSEDQQDEAYQDRPLLIGHNQTISQPYMVAYMTEALELRRDEKTLEIGTGSGYQAAILAELCKEVYTVERVGELQARAKEVLSDLGYRNIFFGGFDGTVGWEEHRPYDAIIVTAGAPSVPQPLKDQLAEGGRLVIPVGDKLSQELIRIIRREGGYIEDQLGGCRFVGLIGAHGWQSS